MTDREHLIEALHERYGQRLQHYEGAHYLGGWRLNLDKLETDFHRWRDERSPSAVSTGT